MPLVRKYRLDLLQGFFQTANSFVNFFGSDVQWGHEPDRVGTYPVEQDAGLVGGGKHLPGNVAVEIIDSRSTMPRSMVRVIISASYFSLSQGTATEVSRPPLYARTILSLAITVYLSPRWIVPPLPKGRLGGVA